MSSFGRSASVRFSAHPSIEIVYTTFILGTVLLNFGTRTDNIGHGPSEFCRVNAEGSLGPPKKWHACKNKRYSRLQSFWAHKLTTTAKALGSKMRACFFSGIKMAAKNRGKMWSNEARFQRWRGFSVDRMPETT